MNHKFHATALAILLCFGAPVLLQGCSSSSSGGGDGGTEEDLPIKPVTPMERAASCEGTPLVLINGLDGIALRGVWTPGFGNLCKGAATKPDCQKQVADRLAEKPSLAAVGTRGETLVDIQTLSEAFGLIDTDAKAIALVRVLYPGGNNINPVQVACGEKNISGGPDSFTVRGYESACGGRVVEVLYTVTKEGVVTAGPPRVLRERSNKPSTCPASASVSEILEPK